MVDGSSIRCEGTVTCRIRLGPRDISAQFYVVPGITEGILRLDALSHLDLQIDTRTRRLLYKLSLVIEDGRMSNEGKESN